MRAILTAGVLAAALPASAQSPGTVLVEQTVADGRGGTYTRIVERPAGYVPVTRVVPVYSAPQMHGAFAPAVPVTFYAPVPVYSAPPACVGGRCFR